MTDIVKSHMIFRRHDDKVLNPVIEAIAVDVMDHFITSQWPANDLLHDIAMLENPKTRLRYLDFPVEVPSRGSLFMSREQRLFPTLREFSKGLFAGSRQFIRNYVIAAIGIEEVILESTFMPVLSHLLSASAQAQAWLSLTFLHDDHYTLANNK